MGSQKVADFEEPEMWMSAVCRALATLLLVSAGHEVTQLNQQIVEFVSQGLFLQHIMTMQNASSMLVLKVASILIPGILVSIPEITSQFKEYLEDTLETRLELQSEICEDLIENLVEDEQNLFFDVLVDDEARRNLMPKRLQHLLKEWGSREINLFK